MNDDRKNEIVGFLIDGQVYCDQCAPDKSNPVYAKDKFDQPVHCAAGESCPGRHWLNDDERVGKLIPTELTDEGLEHLKRLSEQAVRNRYAENPPTVPWRWRSHFDLFVVGYVVDGQVYCKECASDETTPVYMCDRFDQPVHCAAGEKCRLAEWYGKTRCGCLIPTRLSEAGREYVKRLPLDHAFRRPYIKHYNIT